VLLRVCDRESLASLRQRQIDWSLKQVLIHHSVSSIFIAPTHAYSDGIDLASVCLWIRISLLAL
jgi:hypothetical protein